MSVVEDRVFAGLVGRRCPVCGSGDESRVFAANIAPRALDRYAFASRKEPEYMHYRLVNCPVCDLLYANPAPQEVSLAEAYAGAAYDSAAEARYAARTYASFLPQIASRLPSRDGLLDIGAGDGAFLAEAIKRGFRNVVGVEPSAAPIASASPGMRRLIRQDIFRGGDYTPGQYSLVTCFQTIEHVGSPLALCRDAHGLLRAGGALFLICHNRKSLSARLLGKRSPIFDIEHLQLFSPSSVENMLRRAGFGAVVVHSVYNRYPLGYWFRLLPFPRRAKHLALAALDRTGMARLPVILPAGNIAAVGYKVATGVGSFKANSGPEGAGRTKRTKENA